MIAIKMIEMMERSILNGSKPLSWKVRDKTLADLRRQSRHTGDVQVEGGRIMFLNVPIEVGEVRNSLGAELVTGSSAH